MRTYKIITIPYTVKAARDSKGYAGVIKNTLTASSCCIIGDHHYLACKTDDNSILVFNGLMSIEFSRSYTGTNFKIIERNSAWKTTLIEYNENNKDVAKITY